MESMSSLIAPWLTLPQSSGVYAIVGNSSGKIYVGSTRNIRNRIRQHIAQLKTSKHGNYHLQSAWNLYGETDFSFRVLDLVATDALISVEQSFIDQYEAANRACGYNILPNARSPLGRTYSDEAKRRMSEGCKCRQPISAETRLLLSSIRKGVKRDPAIGRKTGNAQRGKVIPPEQRAQISATLLGRKLSPDHCAKISAAGIGRKMSPENVAKIIERNTGRSLSAESRAKTAAALRGRKMSPEACAKMAESQKRRWAAIRSGVAA